MIKQIDTSQFWMQGPALSIAPPSKIILRIDPAGQIWRDDKRLEDLQRDDLLTVIKELIAVMRRG